MPSSRSTIRALLEIIRYTYENGIPSDDRVNYYHCWQWYTSQQRTNRSNARRQRMALYWYQNQVIAPSPLREFVATVL